MERTRATLLDHSTVSPGYAAPACSARGSVRSSPAQPDGYSLWALVGELDAGAEMEWGTAHGDEALAVLTGSLLVEGRGRCGAGGAESWRRRGTQGSSNAFAGCTWAS